MSSLATIATCFGVIVVVLLAISLYLMTTGRLKPADWLEHSLGIPTGSVRALLAFLIIFIVIWAVMEGDKIQTPPDWLIGVLGSIIGFYFGAKGAGLPKKEDDVVGKLEGLKGLKDSGAITEQEFEDKKKNLLSKL